MITFAQKLSLVAKLSGLTQEGLAHKLGVSFVTVNSWLNGKSEPRRNAAAAIDALYLELTGQKAIPANLLDAKKRVLADKSRAMSGILATILKRPDLMDEFTLRLTYNTNRIEGSTLSEDETADILFRNRTLKNHSLTEQMEAKNHQTAWRFLLDHLKARKPIDEALILRLHAILMNGIRDDAGFYRRHGVRILGANVPTANFLKLPDLMPELVAHINSKQSDLIGHVAETHARFEAIHPFADGNGRIGRLLIQAMLLPKNYPPAVIRQEKKKMYMNCLNIAQTKGDHSLLTDFLCDAALEGFKLIEND